MARGLCRWRPGDEHGPRDSHVPRAPPGACHHPRRHDMQTTQWQTPTAIDWRFGFEITLYVAAR